MNFRYLYIALFTILFQSAALTYQDEPEKEIEPTRTVYLIKSYWHVGILFHVDSTVIKHIPALITFNRYKFVDIGWGDEDFYQDPETDYYNAAKAILFPTKSVIKVTGHMAGLESIKKWSDFCIKIKITNEQYSRLMEFIAESFLVENDKYVIASSNSSGAIVFYKSVLAYHLFNTCNTWVADALENAGCDVSKDGIITAEDLFEEVKSIGEVLKVE
jgi:hypothetical protein